MSSTALATPRVRVRDVLGRAVAIVHTDPRILGVTLVGGILGGIPIIGGLARSLANGVAVDMATQTFEEQSAWGTALSSRLIFLAVGWVLLVVIVAIGLLLLVHPGIYLGVRFALFPATVMVDGHGPLQGLSESWDRTAGHGTTVFGFVALLFVLVFVVLAVLYVALFGFQSPQAVDTLSFRLIGGLVGAPFGAVNAAGVTVMYDVFDADGSGP